MAESKSKKKAAPKPKRAATKPTANKKAAAKKRPAAPRSPRKGRAPRSALAQEDALALAEALVEMVNDGASSPVAFFVSADDPLGRELIELQGQGSDVDGMIPVVLDSAAVRRYAMLSIADELLWRNAKAK